MTAEARVGFDARMWSHPGIGRYIRELLTAFRGKNLRYKLSLLASKEDAPTLRDRFPEWVIISAKSKIYSLGERNELENFSQSVDLMHVPHFNVPTVCHSKLVATVHDLIYLQPARQAASLIKSLVARAYFKSLCRHAQHIIAVSEFTRSELCRAFPEARSKSTVIHEAASGRFHPDKGEDAKRRLEDRYAIRRPFFVFVGTLKPHKNLDFLVGTFKEARARGAISRETELLLVGKRDPKEKKLLQTIQNASVFGVRHLEGVPDEDLSALYSQAISFIMPSTVEGFGLPLLEAMSCGAACLSSNRSSLREVGGDAVLYFDPTLRETLVDALIQIQTQKELSMRLRHEALLRAKTFSWNETASKTLAVYEKALS